MMTIGDIYTQISDQDIPHFRAILSARGWDLEDSEKKIDADLLEALQEEGYFEKEA